MSGRWNCPKCGTSLEFGYKMEGEKDDELVWADSDCGDLYSIAYCTECDKVMKVMVPFHVDTERIEIVKEE